MPRFPFIPMDSQTFFDEFNDGVNAIYKVGKTINLAPQLWHIPVHNKEHSEMVRRWINIWTEHHHENNNVLCITAEFLDSEDTLLNVVIHFDLLDLNCYSGSSHTEEFKLK